MFSVLIKDTLLKINVKDTPENSLYIIAGRPTEIPEVDVYICESKYHETEKTLRRLSKGLKVSLFASFHSHKPSM